MTAARATKTVTDAEYNMVTLSLPALVLSRATKGASQTKSSVPRVSFRKAAYAVMPMWCQSSEGAAIPRDPRGSSLQLYLAGARQNPEQGPPDPAPA
mmetsp:Transcript_14734/g.41314  ORF Transcript_14734/g.41314 Transcript_14734/m.41314 type:complete len:97 (+) Transcript_14734:245-535(+)